MCLSSLWQVPGYFDEKASHHCTAWTITWSLIKFTRPAQEARKEGRKESGEQRHLVELRARPPWSTTSFAHWKLCASLSLGLRIVQCLMTELSVSWCHGVNRMVVKWIRGSWSWHAPGQGREEEEQNWLQVFAVVPAVQTASFSVQMSLSEGAQQVFIELSEPSEPHMKAGPNSPVHGAEWRADWRAISSSLVILDKLNTYPKP